MSQPDSWEMDYMVDLAHADDIYIMPILKHHDQQVFEDAELRVIGRKNATFAMLYVQNTTGTWASMLRDGQTPTPSSGSITLKGMQVGTSFTIRWIDTDSGAVVKSDRVTASSAGLLLAVPRQVSQSIAAIVTTG